MEVAKFAAATALKMQLVCKIDNFQYNIARGAQFEHWVFLWVEWAKQIDPPYPTC
jgi:hypothetical protein